MRSGSVPEQVKALLDVEVDPAAEIGDLFGDAPKKKTIHVFVAADREILRAETREPETAPHPSRKRQWDKLNEVLKKNKKAKNSTGFSYVSFREIDKIMPAATYVQTSKPIADEKLDAVHDYFPILLEAFGDIVTAKRLHFIVPVLASVCALFNGDARILAEEKVEGKRVHGDGAFEFVLQRVNKRVCVVVAKRDDIQQGLVQAYVGSEGLADVEGLTKVYSIVTNFVEWYFSRSLDEKIERTSPTTIVMENDVPTRESVKRIAEMLYSILSDDN
ncbi:hypothetical protein DVH05_026271 [Phytophthora capsici]|nr:hypothetical protein DVH05_026271 [Phytophthora capsici]